MKIIIMHETITNHDAIGNDIEMMYHFLSKKYECKAYAQNQLNHKVEYIKESELKQELSDPLNLIIYHHSVFWEKGEALLDQWNGGLIIRYHNITPPEFFQPYNEFHFSQCSFGREQTLRIAKKYTNAFWMVDSLYNAEDIKGIVDSERIDVCPPFNKIEEWAKKKPDENILKELLWSSQVNILFVGRVAPNKGHLFLMDIMKSYCVNYGTDVKLRIIGKFDSGIPGYNDLLREKINQYGIGEYVEFIGEITDATLMSYYLGSDIFICVSDHEGFCVPIPEAQYFQLPILAKNACAVPETIGKNQVILGENAKEYAAAIHIIVQNEKAKKFLRQNGVTNFNHRFTVEKIVTIFEDILKRRFDIIL